MIHDRPMSQLTLDLGWRPAFGIEDFAVGAANRDAVRWLDRWPDWPAPALAVHGPPACGKTHLAQVWRRRGGALSLTLADLSGASPEAILGETRAVVIDGADGGDLDQRALLHLHNVIAERRGHLLLTGRGPPARWPLTLADLRSRLAASPAVAMGAPDDALIAAVMTKLFTDRGLAVDRAVIAFALARIERSFAAAQRLVAALDRAALAAHRRVTVPLAGAVLADLETSRHQEQE